MRNVVILQVLTVKCKNKIRTLQGLVLQLQDQLFGAYFNYTMKRFKIIVVSASNFANIGCDRGKY